MSLGLRNRLFRPSKTAVPNYQIQLRPRGQSNVADYILFSFGCGTPFRFGDSRTNARLGQQLEYPMRYYKMGRLFTLLPALISPAV
jgi:hypothetical protein